MDDVFPETINGVCVKVEPACVKSEPHVSEKSGNDFGDRYPLQRSPFENGTANFSGGEMTEAGSKYSDRHTPTFSRPSEFHPQHGLPYMYEDFRKSDSPAVSDDFKSRMSPMENNFATSTPSVKPESIAPRLPSYHLSKGTPPSMLGNSIYSYAAFNDDSFSKMNSMLKNDTNGEDIDEEECKLNLTYPGTARPIGKKAHLPKRYKCAMCAYKTRYKSDLNRHVRKHAIAGYNCDICNMPFKTVGNVEFHKRREHADTYVAMKPEKKSKYNCKICNFTTMQSSELARHVRKHCIAKFSCDMCNRPFMSAGSLFQHKRTLHNITDEKLQTTQETEKSGGQEGIQTEPTEDSDDENYRTVPNRQESVQSYDISNGALEKTKDAPEKSNGDTNHMQETVDTEATNGTNSINLSNVGKSMEIDENVPENLVVENGTNKEPKDGDEVAKYICQFCDKPFGRKLALDYHLKIVHKMTIRGEDSAFLEYDDDYDIALDMSIKDLENNNKSPMQEEESFGEREDFKNMRHQCPFCAYATNYKSTYDRHVKKHDLECHICPVCKMPFITFGHMQRHIRDNHQEYHRQTTDDRNGTENGLISPKENLYANGIKPPLKMAIKRDFNKPCNSGVVNYQAVNLNGHARIKSNVATNLPSKRKKQTPVQRQLEQGVSLEPPAYGRYAKLVSDFDDFSSRPFACALCFFRTNNADELSKHTRNHLTGCNPYPVPETARFNMAFMHQFQNRDSQTVERPEPTKQQQFLPQNNIAPAFRKPNNKLQDVISKLWSEPKSEINNPDEVSFEEEEEEDDNSRNISDSIIPTFSVHYRKDKTNLTRPYLCLLCRKRFRLLTILKQHFRQSHSESQINNKSYTCSICGEVFHSPVLLQEHHDFHHKMQS